MTELNFGKISDYTEQIRCIKELALKLRGFRPHVETTWDEPVDWVVKGANIHGNPVQSLAITLTPTGCEWAGNGGCTMCGEFEGSTKGKIVPAEFHIAQFASAVSKYIAEYNPEWIRVYQEGNYINSNEIENSAQLTILRLSSLIGGIQRITIESMAKYLKQDNVQELKNAVTRDVELEIGMGFEGENNIVRNVCVNKGESIEDYKRAVSILKNKGVRSLAYVLLKPPFMSESEAIEEAIATIQMAHEIGFDAVSLEPASIHPYTLLHALNLEGLYQPPWLWSVVKVAQNVRNIKDFRIGGVGYYPRPITVAHNKHPNGSDDCNEKLWLAMKEYGKSRKIDIFDDLDCACKKEWGKECQVPVEPLKTRINQQLSCLDLERYKQSIFKKPYDRQSGDHHKTAIADGTIYNFEE